MAGIMPTDGEFVQRAKFGSSAEFVGKIGKKDKEEAD